MARVTSQKNARQNGGSGNNRGSQIAKQQHKTTQKQKVILENNQGKGKGHNVVSSSKHLTAQGSPSGNAPAHRSRQLSFHTEPPPGYTFIPAGNSQLTAALKEYAKRGNHKIYSVSTTPHASRHELSREVHRVGFHFPTSVVAQVCNHYGIRLTRAGRVIDEKENDNFMKVYQKGQLVLDEKIKDQVTVNTEAKEVLKDLFPHMPDNDMFQIIKTAFQLGDGKVGTADDIPLHRRASLSVVAHIRHVYTRYDSLLRKMPYNNARHEVEAETLSKLVEWRGDAAAESSAINAALDDVIVISDEEKSDTEDDGAHYIPPNDVRVEELDGSAYWPAVARPLSPLRIVDQVPPVHLPSYASYHHRPNDAEIATRERNRAARWEQARQDYRSTVSQAGPSYQRVIMREPSPVRRLIPLDPPQERIIQREYIGPARPGPLQIISRPGSPMYSGPQMRHGRLDDGYDPSRPTLHARSRPLTPLAVTYRRRSASPDGDRTIIQSIEGPNGAYSPSILRTNSEAMRYNDHILPQESYRDRRDYQVGRTSPIAIPAQSQRNPFGVTQQHSHTISDVHGREQPMELSRSGRGVTDMSGRQQRILLPEGDPVYYTDRGHPRRTNPFHERPLESGARRLDIVSAPPRDQFRTVHPATTPRRILEPIADDPYSDAGPQRYREYIPGTESYYASSAPTTSQHFPEMRRIVYANPPEEYITTTRYEPLDGR